MTTGLDTKILSVVFLRHGHALVHFGIIQLPVSLGNIVCRRCARVSYQTMEPRNGGHGGMSAAGESECQTGGCHRLYGYVV
jgi:hypothetical protein